MIIHNFFPLKKFHTLAINNITARKIFIVNTCKELILILKYTIKNSIPFIILGKGSNTFFIENYLGTIIINRIKGLSIYNKKNHWLIHAYSGENWHNLVKKTLKMGCYGLENLAMIPGSIGSAIIQNIGAYGKEIKDICCYVDIFCYITLKIKRINIKSYQFSYRDSIFKKKLHKLAIIAVGLQLKKSWKPVLSHYTLNNINPKKISPFQIFNIICSIRKKLLPDPKILGNSGSFFKNPIINTKKFECLKKRCSNIPYCIIESNIKLSAGWLIQNCGLLNYNVGGASIYDKRPNILINKNNASCSDFLNLIKNIFVTINHKFNIKIEPEVSIIAKYNHINYTDII